MMDGYGPWMMMGGWVLGFLLIAVLVGAIVYLIARGIGGSERGSDAFETLRGRFARGEIDRAEYEERVAVLSGKAPPERPRA